MANRAEIAPVLLIITVVCLSWLALGIDRRVMAGDRPAGPPHKTRSAVMARHGMAATSQPLATEAAIRILRQGGNAVDAAIAANAVLAVVEPMKTGLGGDLFVLYWEAGSGKLVGLNASGTAPKALSPEFLARQGIKTMPQSGIHSFTVPGAVEGWAEIHKRYGKLAWKELFPAAIAYAEQEIGRAHV